MRGIERVVNLCLLETEKMKKEKEMEEICSTRGRNSMDRVTRACLLSVEIPQIERQITEELAS